MKQSFSPSVSKKAWRIGFTVSLVAIFASANVGWSEDVSYKIKRKIVGPGKWIVEVEGGLTDHPERIHGLAQLNAAKFALKSGYSFFRITDTKKAIKCHVSKEYGNVTGGIAKVGNAILGGKKLKTGYLNAKEYVAKHEANLLREPTLIQKQKTSAAFVSHCLAKEQEPIGSLY